MSLKVVAGLGWNVIGVVKEDERRGAIVSLAKLSSWVLLYILGTYRMALHSPLLLRVMLLVSQDIWTRINNKGGMVATLG